MHWLLYAIGGAMIIGVFVGLFKIPAYKGYNSLAVLLFCFLTSGLVALVLFHTAFSLTSPGVLMCAFVWGFLFALMSALQMYTLRFIDVGVLSPVTSAANLAGTILLSALFLAEHFSIYAWIGIFCSIVIVAAMQDKKNDGAAVERGRVPLAKVYLLCAAIVLLNIGYSFFLKYETSHYSIEAIQLYQYFFAGLATLSFALVGRGGVREAFRENKVQSLKWGVLLGTLSVFGGYMYYLSIEYGPFAIASAINALYIVVAVIVASLVFKEKLTKKRLLLLGLAFVAVLLMQL